MAQEAFGGYDHDSLQYHFFCGKIVGAARLFRAPSLDHASLWIFDGERLTETASSAERIVQGSGGGLDSRAGSLSFVERDGAIQIEAGTGADAVALTLVPNEEIGWDDTISTVIHQPDLDCKLSFRGATYSGTAYCKRYTWTPAPRHWGYRFVQGYAGDGAVNAWTAEATFGTEKYDYFKLLAEDGTVLEAGPTESCHRQNSAHGRVAGQSIDLELEELAVWNAPLRSERMDSLLRQRVCRLTANLGGTRHSGFAINETCYGTLG